MQGGRGSKVIINEGDTYSEDEKKNGDAFFERVVTLVPPKVQLKKTREHGGYIRRCLVRVTNICSIS